MTQRELDLAVSKTLGEEISDISRRGFSLVDPDADYFDPDSDCQPPQVIDFDARFSGTTQSFFDTL